MHNSRIIFLTNDSVRAIAGKYEDGGKSEVFKTFDDTLAVDDMVVVESTTRWAMTTVRITEIDVDIDIDAETPVKWVIQRIDEPGFEKLKADEATLISKVQTAQKRKKREELRAAMLGDHGDVIEGLALADHSEEKEELTE